LDQRPQADYKLPFDERNFIMFLNQHKLDCLKLSNIRLKSEEACGAVAEAEIQYVDLKECRLVDGGGALIESSVREGRGPKGFRVCGDGDDEDDDDDDNDDELLPFASPEWCISFMHAVRDNSYVERLDLSNIHVNDGILQALASALRENIP
jgi:hypothetical protein